MTDPDTPASDEWEQGPHGRAASTLGKPVQFKSGCFTLSESLYTIPPKAAYAMGACTG